MKKIVSLILSMAIFLSLSTSVMAEAPKEDVGNRVGYAEYNLDELAGEEGIMPRASSSEDIIGGEVMGMLHDYGVGTLISTSAFFDITRLPTGAVIKNIQAWNPKEYNISQGKYTSVDSIQLFHDGSETDAIKYWVIDEPTSRYPCNSTALNGVSAEGRYEFRITGTVIGNYTGFDGFTVRGTKIRVTYTY